jgi:HlyD family secretion protein
VLGHANVLCSDAGVQVTAEIHLGTRTVLEYLLSRVQDVVHEAGRER